MSTVHASPGTNEPVSEATDETISMNGSPGERMAVAEELEKSGVGPAALAAMGSVALALYYYYVRGEKERGQFIGLWPPTILGMATYLKLDQIKRMLRESED